MSTGSVCIVDYGVGNLGSITSLLRRNGKSHYVSSDPREVEGASIILLSGVGAFDFAMQSLNEKGLSLAIRTAVLEKQCKLVGICLGLQLLFDNSEEGAKGGLGFISGTVKRFSSLTNQEIRIPHMGWRSIELMSSSSIFGEKLSGQRFYFNHSYYASPKDHSTISHSARYGLTFPAIIEHQNIIGLQFHPEKSSLQGTRALMRILGG